jgi:2-polyprenyl-6-methoxyphenol hydroxylase-like FAD-dependent oxidoreductase
MADIIIVGGSVSGLASALALSQAGHSVDILERETVGAPDTVEEAHSAWPRPTVPQATHSHAFGSLGVGLLRKRAPEIYQALVDAGAAEISLGERMPPSLTDRTPEPGDEELRMLGCRRSTFELVLRQQVLAMDGVRLHPRVTVRGLEMAGTPAPRVTGVRTANGNSWHGDLVIDATGRRSAASDWLSDAGIAVAEDRIEDCEITYYTRFYRQLTPRPPGPLNRGFGAGWLWDFYTAVLFLGDNQTFSISIGVLPEDKDAKLLRVADAFTAVLRATPLLAPWIEPGVSEPISDVYAMGGLDNSLRGFGTATESPVTGLFRVGDSVCTTNPAYGRGVSLALAHAYQLTDVLGAYPDPSPQQSAEVAAMTTRLMMPWWTDSVMNDKGRAMLWRAGLAGAPPPAPPQGVVTFGAAAAAAATDPFVWRRMARVMMSLSPPATLYGDEEVRRRVGKALAAQNGHGHGMPGPSRAQFVEAVTAAA